jgi:ankyrin repeat protein
MITKYLDIREVDEYIEANISSIFIHCSSDFGIIKLLVNSFGGEIDFNDMFNQKILERAMSKLLPNVVIFLLENGAVLKNRTFQLLQKIKKDSQEDIYDSQDQSENSIYKCRQKVLEAIIKFKRKDGKNILMDYVTQSPFSGDEEVLDFLLTECKLNINEKDKAGKTAFFHAIETEDYNMAIDLYNRNADINIISNNGKHAIDDLLIPIVKKHFRQEEDSQHDRRRKTFSVYDPAIKLLKMINNDNFLSFLLKARQRRKNGGKSLNQQQCTQLKKLMKGMLPITKAKRVQNNNYSDVLSMVMSTELKDDNFISLMHLVTGIDQGKIRKKIEMLEKK